MRIEPLCYLALDTVEGTSADEEDIARVNMYVVLVRMLASALGRHVHHRSFQEFQQSLLYALSAHVTGNARVVTLTGNLVYFVDEDDAALRRCHVVVGNLQETRQNALHIFSYIAGFSEDSRIDNGERYVKELGNRAGKQGLSRTCGPYHDDIALFDFHTVVVLGLLQPFVMIVDRYRKIAFRFVLTDDILVKVLLDFLRFRHFLHFERITFTALFLCQSTCLHDNVVSLLRTVLTDITVQTRDKELHIFLVPTAKTTFLLGHCLSFTLQHCLPVSSSAPHRSYRTPWPLQRSSSSYGHCRSTPCRTAGENGC